MANDPKHTAETTQELLESQLQTHKWIFNLSKDRPVNALQFMSATDACYIPTKGMENME